MISDLLLYFFCSVLSILLVFGITAWVTICFCADMEHGCVTVIAAGPDDHGTLKQLASVIRSDRLLNRTSSPIVIDRGAPAEVRAGLRRLADDGRIVLVRDDPSALAAAIRSSLVRSGHSAEHSVKN